MISVKTPEEIKILREGGKKLANILIEVSKLLEPGVSTTELNDRAHEMMIEGGDTPAFLNYTPYGASRPYPASLCVSINDEIVHGIPNEEPTIIKEGDLVTLDGGLTHRGLITDSAITLGVGKVDETAQKLLEVGRKSLLNGIATVKHGARVGDIGAAVEATAKEAGFCVYRELVGHSVGYSVHEGANIPNFGKKGSGEELTSGMVLAIEPMLGEGSDRIILDDDGYTYRTRDGSRSVHFEHTVVVTDKGAEILTLP